MRCSFNLVFDSVAEEVRNSPSIQRLLEVGDKDGNSAMATRRYLSHPDTETCLNETGRFPMPIAVYLDGVRYTPLGAGKTDNILQISIINMISNKRHLASVSRSNDKCACGCKGHCTTHSLLSVLDWELQAMVKGFCPSERHSGEAWGEKDTWRDKEGTRSGRLTP